MKKYLFYSFGIICLSAIFSCNGITFKKQAQPAKDISPTVASTPTKTPSALPSVKDSSTEQPTNSSSNRDAFHIPITPSVPVIPSVVSEEEIAMREEQVKLAQENKRLAELRMQAGIGTRINMYKAEYFVLSNKIQLLQAKKLLKLKQPQEENKEATN